MPARSPSEFARHPFIAALTRVGGCELLLDPVDASAQGMVDRDHSEHGTNTLRVWQNYRCIVASRAQSALPTFVEAASLSASRNWPVAVRRSGGSAVVHRPGIANITWTASWPEGQAGWMSVGYTQFVAMLIDALSEVGVAADHGPVPGSYCDGRFNVRVDGRKLAGTAAHSRVQQAARICTFHASVTLDGSSSQDVLAVQQFERALGMDNPYDPTAHITLEEALLSRNMQPHDSNAGWSRGDQPNRTTLTGAYL